MTLTARSFSFFITTCILFFSVFAQAGSGFSKDLKLRQNRQDVSGVNELIPRATGDPVSPAQFGGQVSWVDWTAGDGQKTGGDADKVWYVADAISLYLSRFSDAGKRTGVFWAGGATTEDDFETVDEFMEINLNFGAQKADTVYPYSDFTKMNLDESNKGPTWWRAINRMSKALAATCTNGVAYVYLKNNSCRTLFSPSSQNPMDNDPTANGQATNGEIWYYAELPTLMRNTNIKQIKTFSKVNRKFVVNTEWDVDVDTDKPRDFLPDIAMDATPIVLPPAAGRPPMKRAALPAGSVSVGSQGPTSASNSANTVSATSLAYQQGAFDVQTLHIAGLTSNSATTCTAKSGSATITTTVPIWSCTACSIPYNALFVSPISLSGPPGLPSPPPSYPPLKVGSDMLPTPVSLPTGISLTGNIYSFITATSSGSLSATESRSVSSGYRSSGSGSLQATGSSSVHGESQTGSGLTASTGSLSAGETRSVSPGGASSDSVPSSVAGRSSSQLESRTATGLTASGAGTPSSGSIGLSSASQTRVASTLSATDSIIPSSGVGTASHTGPLSSAILSGVSTAQTSGGSSGPSSGNAQSVSTAGTHPPPSGLSSSTGIGSGSAATESRSSLSSRESLATSANTTNTGSHLSSGSSSIITSSFSKTTFTTSLGVSSTTPPSNSRTSLQTSGPGASSSGGSAPATTTIAAVGPLAKSSAAAISSSIVIIGPPIQRWIDNPGCASCSTDAINAIKSLIPKVKDLEDELGPNPDPKPCGVSSNPITDIFNAVSCADDTLNKAIDDIEGNTPDDVQDDLTNLNNLKDPLQNDEDQDPSASGPSQSNPSQSQPSRSASSQSQASTSSKPQSSNTSGRSSSTATTSVSSTSRASSSTLSSSASSSALACAFNPVSDISNSIPLVQYATTAWWDYGISCAGSCSDFTAPASSVSGAGASLTLGTGSLSAATGSGVTTSLPSRTASPSRSDTSSGGVGSATPASSSSPRSATTTSFASMNCMPDGAPWYSPTSWCDCGSATYAALGVVSSQANCAFTETPSSTIQPVSTTAAPTNVPGQNGLPGCNYILANDPREQNCPGVAYCDCGGTYTHLITTSASGTVSYNCDYKTQPTANDCPINTASILSASSASVLSASSVAALPNPTPTGTSTCFPWHDSFDLQGIMTLDEIHDACSGNQSGWSYGSALGDPAGPIDNNDVSSGYTLSDNAPSQCHDLYTNDMSDFVISLCTLPLQQIWKDCGYNGGSISNVCGSWWMQTCPLGGDCPVGCPGGAGSCGTPTPYPAPSKRAVGVEQHSRVRRASRFGIDLRRFEA